MNKICIINLNCTKVHEDDINKGCGGSETWLIKISETFTQIKDIEIYIIAVCDTHMQNNRIYWESLDMMEEALKTIKFDAIIISRIINDDVFNLIKENQSCDLYIMAHDTFIINSANKPANYNEFDDWIKDHLKKVFVLSDMHKMLFNVNWNFPNEKLCITANGLDFSLFENLKNDKRDNSILWSIRYERDFNVLADLLAPIIRKYIPDFKIYTCSYSQELPQKYKNVDYIIDLGRLSKDELYNEMSKHKVYFHPMLFFETFCISILEAIMCGCNLITANNYGAATTLMPYSGFLLSNTIDYKQATQVNAVALKIIESIFEYNSETNRALRSSMQSYLKQKYSWEKIAENMLDVMNLK